MTPYRTSELARRKAVKAKHEPRERSTVRTPNPTAGRACDGGCGRNVNTRKGDVVSRAVCAQCAIRARAVA